MNDLNRLDSYLPARLRHQIEGEYYAKVNEQARLEVVAQDEEFLNDIASHVTLYGDHGVVHVRDVANQILYVLDAANGTLIPQRSNTRLNFFMKGYGVILAYLHDIGMANHSAMGRATHPEFASQKVFYPEFDDIIDTIWDENWGNIAWRLLSLNSQGVLEQDPRLMLREMMSLSNCHSKTKVPIDVLIDRQLLRKTMQETISTSLDVLYLKYRISKAQDDAARFRLSQQLADESQSAAPQKHLTRFYSDFQDEAYRWLLASSPEMDELIEDVTDTLRALRVADALRQRGTVLKTSGSYEIFVDQKTANAIYALRYGDNRLFMMERADPISAGEANLAASELSTDGSLRIAFHHGRFDDESTIQRAAYYAAYVVNDIQADFIDSFRRKNYEGVSKPHDEIQILLEGVDDNHRFAELVCEQLMKLNPALQDQVQAVPSLQNVSDLERDIYLQSREVDWTAINQQELLEHLAESGQNLDRFDPQEAFQHVRLITIKAGDTIIEANSPASFVYIPFEEGLKIIPLGGYQTFSVQAWMPLGNTGVIRGAIRNATVVSERDMQLLMIPKEVYLRSWYRPYTSSELAQLLREISSEDLYNSGLALE